MKEKATKHDEEKLRMDLIPPEIAESLARVLGDGARKYSAFNYRKGIKWSRYYSALLRHVFAWWRGEDKDPESGFHHLEHVLTNASILCDMVVYGNSRMYDDRPTRVKKRKKQADRKKQ